MATRKIFISHNSKGWALKRGGSNVVAGVYPTKGKAIAAAESIAEKDSVNLIFIDGASAKSSGSSRRATRSSATGKFSTGLGVKTGKSTKLASSKATGAKNALVTSKKLSPKVRAERWREWADSHKSTGQPLSDEAISRESIYEGRG